jgi:hypothetical protein
LQNKIKGLEDKLQKGVKITQQNPLDTVDFPSNTKQSLVHKNSATSEGCFTFHNTDARETMNVDDQEIDSFDIQNQ